MGTFRPKAHVIPQYQVTHIRLSSTGVGLLSLTYEHIELLKGPGFVKTREQVVHEIDHSLARYFTNEAPQAPRAYLEVQQTPGLTGTRYVRTQPDCSTLNNLLNLPRF